MGVNKVILVGNLGKDPELRYTQSQTPVCTYSLATGERRKDATGNWVDHTEWHNIVCFGKTAEHCSSYLKKGRQVYIEGKIQTRKWQDKEGRDRYTTEVLANTVQFLGTGSGKGAATSGVTMESTPPSNEGVSTAALAGLQSADSLAASPGDDVSFDDDDIPF